MRTLLCCCLVMLWPGAKSIAQTPITNIRPLSVGDTLPDILFENVLNYSTSKIETTDFKDKLLIIEFVATWCGSCLKSLQRLDALQSAFPNELRVVAVSQESSEQIRNYITHRLKWLKTELPFVYSDSILNRLFPYRILPHSVLVKGKKVRAITYPSLITNESISSIINSSYFTLPLKRDVLDFDSKKRVLINENGGHDSNLIIQSSIVKNLSGLPSQIGRTEEKENGLKRKYYINQPILLLYSMVIPEAATNKVLLVVKDKNRFLYSSDDWDSWAQTNAFTYEIIYKRNIEESAVKKKILHDLNSFFRLSPTFETITVDCWVLSLDRKAHKSLATSGRNPESELFDENKVLKHFYNKPISELIKALNYQIPGREITPIVIDETNYSDNIDLELEIANLKDFSTLTQALSIYGLRLKKGKRKMKILILKES